MLIDSLLAGGAERIAVEVACALDRSRFSAQVVVTRHSGPLQSILDEAGVGYTVLGRTRAFSPSTYLEAKRLVASFDLLHAHKFGSNVWGSLLARQTGVPLVVRDPRFSGVRTWQRTYGYRFLIGRTAKRIICPSSKLADSLSAEGVDPALLVVIPNGVRLDAALPRAEARAELGLEADARVVGIVARLRPEKQHEILLRAAARLVRQNRPLIVCIVGDGPTREPLERLASQLGLQDVVSWAGERRDAKRIVSAFDVGVICSAWEGLPVASLEILAAGVPLVSTAVGALPEVLAGGAGLLVEPGDDAGLAAAIAGVLDDRTRAAELGRLGRQRIADQYSFPRMVADFERVYTEVLLGGTRRSGDL
jgi:glycosyltransferase involved in cell wall biosynthesis